MRYGLEDYQHELMANVYIEKMIEAMKEFDNSYEHSYYEALAWSGLEETSDYKRLVGVKIKQLEKTMIKFYSDEKAKKTCQK